MKRLALLCFIFLLGSCGPRGYTYERLVGLVKTGDFIQVRLSDRGEAQIQVTEIDSIYVSGNGIRIEIEKIEKLSVDK